MYQRKKSASSAPALPVSSIEEDLRPDATGILTQNAASDFCFNFSDEKVFSRLASSEIVLQPPVDLDPRMSLLPVLRDHTPEDTWVLMNNSAFDTSDPGFPIQLSQGLCLIVQL